MLLTLLTLKVTQKKPLLDTSTVRHKFRRAHLLREENTQEVQNR